NLALSSIGTTGLDRCDVKPQYRRHCSDPDRYGLLHIGAASADGSDSISKIENAGYNQSREFTQAVPGNEIRPSNALSLDPSICGHRRGQDRRLSIRGQLKICFASRKTHFRERKPERLIRHLEHLACGSKIVK